jgi:hypothetical protein
MKLFRLTDTLTQVQARVAGYFNTCPGVILTGARRAEQGRGP